MNTQIENHNLFVAVEIFKRVFDTAQNEKEILLALKHTQNRELLAGSLSCSVYLIVCKVNETSGLFCSTDILYDIINLTIKGLHDLSPDKTIVSITTGLVDSFLTKDQITSLIVEAWTIFKEITPLNVAAN